ncbi:MAG: hypothetical protein K2H06_00855 [Anaeroplasmataceae bacterium]|nr:hypothetical protein [Anaeroplasmataceae bacterium]
MYYYNCVEILQIVHLFDYALVIVSHGGIPKGMTKGDFLADKTNPVN